MSDSTESDAATDKAPLQGGKEDLTSPPVVILLHGIRTLAYWQQPLTSLLQESIPGLVVRPIKYGYFDAVRLLFPFFSRGGPLRHVGRQIDLILDQYPGRRVVVLAHSFGTYLITALLAQKPRLRLHGLILCGSIVRRGFDWDRLVGTTGDRRQLQFVVNDCGARDIWPLLAQSVTWGYGATGTYGFGDVAVTERMHYLSHSEYLTTDFAKNYWVQILQARDTADLPRTIVPSQWDTRNPPPPTTFPILDFFRVKWLLVAALLFLVQRQARSLVTPVNPVGDTLGVVVSGSIVDANGAGIVNAMVSVEGFEPIAHTAAGGRYDLTLPNVRRGSPIDIEIVHVGHITDVRHVDRATANMVVNDTLARSR